eukprot:gene17403-11882_t
MLHNDYTFHDDAAIAAPPHAAACTDDIEEPPARVPPYMGPTNHSMHAGNGNTAVNPARMLKESMEQMENIDALELDRPTSAYWIKWMNTQSPEMIKGVAKTLAPLLPAPPSAAADPRPAEQPPQPAAAGTDDDTQPPAAAGTVDSKPPAAAGTDDVYQPPAAAGAKTPGGAAAAARRAPRAQHKQDVQYEPPRQRREQPQPRGPPQLLKQ